MTTSYTMQDVVRSLNSVRTTSGESVHNNPDRWTKGFVTEPCKFFELISDDNYDVSHVQLINDDCPYVTYKKSKEFQNPALNTNVTIASYITTHARLKLYSYL